MSAAAELELRGAGGEPVDLWRTLVSQGLAFLPPCRIDEATRAMEVTLPGRPAPRTVRAGERPVGASRAGRRAGAPRR